MDLARYLVDAVVLEGRSLREVARDHGVSKSWVHSLVVRYWADGYEAIAARSKAPVSVPLRTSDETQILRPQRGPVPERAARHFLFETADLEVP